MALRPLNPEQLNLIPGSGVISVHFPVTPAPIQIIRLDPQPEPWFVAPQFFH